VKNAERRLMSRPSPGITNKSKLEFALSVEMMQSPTEYFVESARFKILCGLKKAKGGSRGIKTIDLPFLRTME
jgi:hypothetical protein